MFKFKDQTGFTIAELTVTIAVFAILIPVIATLMMTMNSTNDNARDHTIINGVVENKMENLRSIGYNALTNGTTDFTTELPDTIGSSRSATYVVSDAPTGGLKQIDVTVTYNKQGQSKTLKYKTMIGELGVGQY